MRSSRKGTYCWAVIALLSSVVFLSPVLAAAQNQENPEATRLLAEVRAKAAELSRDADDMESMTRSDVSWQSHAEMLNRIKEHVNDLGTLAEKLQAMRDSSAPWQQTAIDRMIPVMKEMASNTTAAINHINQNRIRPVTGNYPEYLKENAETAHQLANMIASFVQYGQTKDKLDRLEQKLEVASR